MNTASIVASISRNAGGLFESVRRLHQSLAEIPNVRVNVLGLRDKFTSADLSAWLPLKPKTLPTRGPRQFGYAPGLKQTLLELDEDILHTHGIWMYPSVVARDWHRKTGRPYLISAHGMLDFWAIQNSAWKKRLALLFYEREHLENAACLRALCESEARAMRAFGLKNPICIIPNGIDLPGAANVSVGQCSGEAVSGLLVDRLTEITKHRKTLLYLGRIHPKKGLANLLKAWAQIQRTETRGQMAGWVLVIAGWDQGGHEAELKSLASELGLAWTDVRGQRAEGGGRRTEGSSPSSVIRPPTSVLFTGPFFGQDKGTAYANCDAFILPSFSEGLPMVILEAWAYAKPVLMTPECNLPEGFAANAAIGIETDVKGLAVGLEELFRRPSSDLCSLGCNGRTLVSQRFTWPKIAADMKSVYEWVLGGGPKPEWVV